MNQAFKGYIHFISFYTYKNSDLGYLGDGFIIVVET